MRLFFNAFMNIPQHTGQIFNHRYFDDIFFVSWHFFSFCYGGIFLIVVYFYVLVNKIIGFAKEHKRLFVCKGICMHFLFT